MGSAYLSRPIKDKISEDHQNSKLSFGVSSMQGWRIKQEDSHNCILDFDQETSLFGVYDGHGGAEVAIYTSEKLPEYIKESDEYKKGNYKEALISAFLTFDATIPSKSAITRLREIMSSDQDETSTILFTDRAGCSQSDENGDDDDDDDEYSDGEIETETPDSLRKDASKPLEEVIASYRFPHVAKLISGEKSVSPYLRGRRDIASSSGECSSSFMGECSTSFVEAGCSSSGANECSSSSGNGVTDDKPASGSGDADVESSLNGDVAETSSVVKEQSSEVTASSKSKSELTNGPNESAVNGIASAVNGDVSEAGCSKSEPVRASSSQSDEKPSCGSPSSKKKKLALTDLDDSDVVKNFITNDEIDENDEEDSEDETFRLEGANDISDDDDDDDGDDDGDDDEDEDDDDDDDDDDEFEGESFISKLKRRLSQAVAEDDNDDDDEDHVPTSSELNEAEEEDHNLEEEDEESIESSDDENGREVPGVDSGCTAVVALIKGDTVYVANAGDSRCVICKNGQAVDMSEDHKPEDKPECTRILKAGGDITSDGRINGGLNLSRAFGDHGYKKNTNLPNTEQMIIALPDIRTCKLDADVEFIVLACDGIWNSLSSQEVVDFIRPKIQADEKLSTICEQLFDKCLAPHTNWDGTGCDNMTCIIVKPLNDTKNSCNIENDAKTASSSVDSPSSNVDSSKPEDTDEVINEAIPTESCEAETKGESKSDDGLLPTSQKRCADSTENDKDDVQVKRQKTDTEDSS